MASPFIILLLLLIPMVESQLTPDYYNKTCPNFASIVQEVVANKQHETPTTAAGALRLFFHDCIVGGCDASLLLPSSPITGNTEQDQYSNKGLSPDAFDVVTRVKTKLELACPRIVSCADIMAQATRDLMLMIGGPYYPVLLGRKDNEISRGDQVEGHIPRPNMTVSTIIDIFAQKGFTEQEMVALTGAHMIGSSHCSEFADRIYGMKPDPTMNPEYVERLKKLCGNNKNDTSKAAFVDPVSPSKFDNMYYVNLKKGASLLSSDQAIALDPRTKPYVDLYAANQSAWFADFAHAIEKMSVLNVLTGNMGEVRRKCDVPEEEYGE